jgi:hypothetical protein
VFYARATTTEASDTGGIGLHRIYLPTFPIWHMIRHCLEFVGIDNLTCREHTWQLSKGNPARFCSAAEAFVASAKHGPEISQTPHTPLPGPQRKVGVATEASCAEYAVTLNGVKVQGEIGGGESCATENTCRESVSKGITEAPVPRGRPIRPTKVHIAGTSPSPRKVGCVYLVTRHEQGVN